MWRSFFLAVGAFVILMGVECLGVQKFVLKSREETTQVAFMQVAQPGPNKVLAPPDWAPWSLMSSGAVVCLWCFSLPRAP